ncbi:hypothetical protein HMPREF1981_03555 [Bacteroides pyogenes F0041]|uniref:Uncharacterized protein n=1 Tax=Bacteroides pyogenes F0041 TaxID=1321819 RepID=U2C9Y6_9BACE|nr:hypothetical protein [Bacteroides pyogenes]ERI80818.1 hypothetical protein HMPREF1981_03555 [Bacteroides pyogenes F0041]
MADCKRGNESFAERPGISFIKTIKLHAEVMTGLFLQQPKIVRFQTGLSSLHLSFYYFHPTWVRKTARRFIFVAFEFLQLLAFNQTRDASLAGNLYPSV